MSKIPQNMKPKFEIGDKAFHDGELWLVVGVYLQRPEGIRGNYEWCLMVAKGDYEELTFANFADYPGVIRTERVKAAVVQTIAEMKAETYRKRAAHIAKLEAELEAEREAMRKEVGVHVVGSSEGDVCGFDGCEGTIGFAPVINCSCHIVAPCGNCECNPLHCLTCGRHIETGGKR